MKENNKLNTVYFENSSMKGLYETMQNWQQENLKRLLSISIQNDNGIFCCIALTNPTEVVIVNGHDGNTGGALVKYGRLYVNL